MLTYLNSQPKYHYQKHVRVIIAKTYVCEKTNGWRMRHSHTLNSRYRDGPPTVRRFSRKKASHIVKQNALPTSGGGATRHARLYKSRALPSTSTQTHGVLRRGRLARASALLGTCRPHFTKYSSHRVASARVPR